jgi:hypothetical protein
LSYIAGIIEASKGVREDAKKRMVEKMTEALDEAWHVPDVRVFIREYPAENGSGRTLPIGAYEGCGLS